MAEDATDSQDQFDRAFESTFRALTKVGPSKLSREEREARGLSLVGHYPEDEKLRISSAAPSTAPIESRQRRRSRGAPVEAEDDVDDTEDNVISDLAELDALIAGEQPTPEPKPRPQRRARETKPPRQPVKLDRCAPPVIDRALRRFSPEGFDLDAAASTSEFQIITARHYFYGLDHDQDLPRVDGLTASWIDIAGDTGLVFLHPDEDEIEAWLSKALDEVFSSSLTVVGLLPSRTGSTWFQTYVAAPGTANAICYVHGLVKFLGCSDVDELIVVLWTSDDKQSERFEQALGSDVDPKLGRALGCVHRLDAV